MPACPMCGRRRSGYYGYIDGCQAFRCYACDWKWREDDPLMDQGEEEQLVRYASVRAFGRYNRLAAPSLDPNRRARYPMPPGTRELITIAGRPWERVWRDDGTYECVPVPDGQGE